MEFNWAAAMANMIFDMAGDVSITVFIQYEGAVPVLQSQRG